VNDRDIRVASLFGGIGGFDLGLQKASPRFKTVWYCDRDPAFKAQPQVAVYNRNFGESWEPADARGVDPRSIPDFDLLCAGFPCQSFSTAGKRRGFDDTRGTLFFEIARIAEARRPRMLLLENVKGLLSHDDGETFRTVLAVLDELGYDAEWEVLNSKHFGVPQNRERVFVVGHLRGEPWREVFPLGQDGGEPPERRPPEECGTPLARALTGGGHSAGLHSAMTGSVEGVRHALDANYYKGVHDIERQRSRTLVFDDYNGRVTDVVGAVRETFGNAAPGNGVKIINATNAWTSEEERTLHEGQEVRALKAGWSHQQESHLLVGKDGGRIRRLTPLECERLQNFPDGWTAKGVMDGKEVAISDSSRYRMLGNAVTVSVVSAIGEKILQVF
jgi:DNA (cytosine-5)-methyltransferase 1